MLGGICGLGGLEGISCLVWVDRIRSLLVGESSESSRGLNVLNISADSKTGLFLLFFLILWLVFSLGLRLTTLRCLHL